MKQSFSTKTQIVRRAHLYLGMLLAPWFLMYGISAMMMNLPGMFTPARGASLWTPRLERTFKLPVDTKHGDEEIARAILRENGLSGPFYMQRPNRKTLIVTHFRFLKRTRFTYFFEEQRLLVEDKKFLVEDLFTGMHARGGFQHESLRHDLWAVVVDVVAVALLFWIASGLYMWLKLSSAFRKWGLLALAAGAVTFGYFLLAL